MVDGLGHRVASLLLFASSQEPELSSFGAGFSVKPEHDQMPVSLTVNPSGPIRDACSIYDARTMCGGPEKCGRGLERQSLKRSR